MVTLTRDVILFAKNQKEAAFLYGDANSQN